MTFFQSPIPDLIVFQPKVFGDTRGFFMESFNEQHFNEALISLGQKEVHFVQDNHSRSAKGVLRGLHYQTGASSQGKLVRVVAGKVWDVAVDVRKASPSYGQWYGLELSAEHNTQFWIPPGFAHGFIVLSESADFLYKTTQYYNPQAERSIIWHDTTLKIAWPLAALDQCQPIVSEKDSKGTAFINAEDGQCD